MKMSDWEAGFAEDLASVTSLAEPAVRESMERIARVWQPMLRNRLMQLMTVVGAELSDAAGMPSHVELRVTGDDISFTLAAPDAYSMQAPAPSAAPLSTIEPADADARISLRINEALKERITEAAAADGMSVNTWIARALDREVAQPRTSHHQSGITTRNQLRGYGRS